MAQFLALVAFIAVVALVVWAKGASRKALNQHAWDRTGHQRGQGAIKTTTSFVVPDKAAAEVVQTVVDTLGYPTTKRALAGEMVLLGATGTEAQFALANKLHESWMSRLRVADESDGAHGSYEVLRWTLVDGVVAGWKEMEIVARRVGEITTALGGTAKVTVPE